MGRKKVLSRKLFVFSSSDCCSLFSLSFAFHPHQCIDNKARKAGINQSVDLPDPTLQFIKLRPLMDQAIQPIGQKPLLVRRGAKFTCIIVNQVQALDGEKYQVMFIGTGECVQCWISRAHCHWNAFQVWRLGHLYQRVNMPYILSFYPKRRRHSAKSREL